MADGSLNDPTGKVLAFRKKARRHIVVGLDGSPQARAALRTATLLCRRHRSHLVAIHVAKPDMSLSTFELSPERSRQAEFAARVRGEKLLEEAQEVASGRVGISTELHFGDPARILTERARELRADLVVVGHRGLSTIERVLIGSVSLAVVKSAPCSVLVVRDGQ